MRYILGSWLIVLLSSVDVDGRTWTDATGKHKFEAEFVEIINGAVKLKKPDGKEITMPLAKLSAEDQAFALRLAKAASVGSGDAPAAESRPGETPASGKAKPSATARRAGKSSAKTKQSPTKIAKTPEEAIALLSEAEDKQDFALLAGIYAIPVCTQYARLHKVVESMQALEKGLEPTLKNRFGDERKLLSGELKPDVKMFVPERHQHKFIGIDLDEGNRKEVTVSTLSWEQGEAEPTAAEGVILVEMQNDRWRVWPRQMVDVSKRGVLEARVDECAAQADACQEWAKDIKSGKFNSADEALEALKSIKASAKRDAFLKNNPEQ